MNSRHIIAEAWHFTRENRRLMWAYAFVPSLLSTLIGILYLVYQFFAFKSSPLFDNASHSFLSEVVSTIVGFLNDHGELWIPAIITVVVVLVLYLLLPTLCQGGLIQIIARNRKGVHVRGLGGISLGLLVFLPLLEYHLIVNGFSLFSLFTEAGFILRNLGPGVFQTLLPVFILAAIVFLILTLLFTYSEFFIVLRRKSILGAMAQSAKLVILSWQHTFLIAILMLIIGLRILINILAVLLVPALLVFSAGFLFTITLTTVGIAVGIIVSSIGLFVASYFTGILNVFANAVWTYTFLALTEEEDIKEHIGE